MLWGTQNLFYTRPLFQGQKMAYLMYTNKHSELDKMRRQTKPQKKLDETRISNIHDKDFKAGQLGGSIGLTSDS